MRYVVQIETENEAFQPDPRWELGRILRALAERLEDGAQPDASTYTVVVRDVNGNKVGTAGPGR